MPLPVSVDSRLWSLARPSPRDSRPTLARIRRLLTLLDNPQEHLATVHVGGTSGKGSTCHLLAAILHAAGYPVGLHSKPHLETVRERLVLGEATIGPEELSALLDRVTPLLAAAPWPEGPPTWFELVVALAFEWFRARHARPVVVEVGLGGTWDATNVLHPLVALLTTVSLDHTQLLGDTVEAIARDKAGILQSGGFAITGARQPSALTVLETRCHQLTIPLWRLGQEIVTARENLSDSGAHFDLTVPGATFTDLELGLLGHHQVDNAALAVAAAVALGKRGFPVTEAAIRQGLLRCRIPGRLERVAGAPTVLLDGAHNPEKMTALAAALRALFPQARPVCVVAMRRGHDIAATLAPLLDVADTLILTQVSADSDWGLEQSVAPAVIQQALAALPQRRTYAEPDPMAALEQARTIAGSGGLVCVTGSLYLVGQLRGKLLDGNASPS